MIEAFHGIKWAHNLVGVDSLIDNQFVQNIVEGAKGMVAKPVLKKNLIRQVEN